MDRDAGARLSHADPRGAAGVRRRRQEGAYGYPSNVEKDEMRAERITVDGKTVEMR